MMLMSTLSLNVFAGSVIPGTKDEKIHLGWKYFEYDEDNEAAGAAVQALEAGKTYCVRLAFFDNPSDENSTVTGATISVRYDAEAVNIPDTGEATVNSVFYEYQGTFIPNNDGNGLLTITLATTSGIRTNRGKLVTAGNFFEAVFEAKKTVTEDELKTLFHLGSETNMIFDVNEKDFTIVECPAFTARVKDGAADFFPTTTAAKIAENLVGEYIDENGNVTAVSDFTVTLPAAGLVKGENVVKVSYNGYTCDVTITVKPDTMTGISITHEPNMSYNSGDKLNLTGLVVSAQYASGDTVELGSGVYATDPAKNTELTVAEHNGKHITVKVGSFTAETTGVLTVRPADISGASIAAVGPFEYDNGNEIKPTPAITLGEKTLENGVDYDLSYENNINVGTATLTATGKGEYQGTVSTTFQITKATGNLTLKVNNEESAVTITYGSAMTFTDGNGMVVGVTKPSDIVIHYKTDGIDDAVYEISSGRLNVGTYTFWLTRSADDNHEAATSNEVVVTIVPRPIANPTATITNFVKGQRIFDLNVETTTPGLSVGSTCYEGTNTDGNPLDSQEKFKAGTLYSIVIGLEADKNHVLNAQTLTVTVNGGEPQTVAIEESGFAGAYKAVVTATTADKDAPTITPNPINATYGDKLFTHTPTGTAIYDGQNVSGTFTWSNKYNAETTVGNAGVNEFDVVFTPTNTDLYATVTGKVTVTVAQKEIDITDKLNTWSANEFTYDGKSHSVELKIDEDLVGIVKVKEYTGDTEAQAVGEYTASASLELVDPANYKFNEDNVLTRDHTWKINKGDLTPTDAEKSVLFGTKEVTVTPADFGLMQDGIKIEVTHAGNSLITGYLPSDDMRSVTFMLRDTDKTDAANNASDTATLKFSSANYNEASGTLTIKIIDKNTDADTLKIDVPATVTYGDTVTPSVGESKPAGAGNVTFKFFDEDNHEVLTTAQPFDAGTYKVTASCESESTIYTAEATFTVEPREIEAKDVAFDKELTYTGNELTQTVTVTVNGKTLTVGTDYTVSDLTGTEPGSYPVTVAGTGNYTGTVTKSFEIAKADISSAEITYDAGPYGYTGKEWKPEVAVSFNDAALTADTDYTVSYENNINAGTAKIIITGIGDHFTGSTEKTFTINSAEISGCTFAPIADVTYNTKAHTPEVTVAISGRTLEADKDYTVSYASNINAGTATVTVTGKGNFTGTASKTFTINKAGLTLNPCTISELCTETDLKTRTLPSDFFLAGETETGFSIELTAVAGGDDIFAVAPAVVEGENKITFRLKNEVGAATFTVTVTPVSGNYNGGSYALTISTHDRTDVSGSISFPDGSAVYTGTGIKYENATISGYSGTLRYGYTPNASTGASLDASGLPLTVGTYTVAVTFNSDASFGYKTATFTITKATPTGTPGYTKLETNGKTLADAKLTVGTIRPAGTIAWDLPLTTVLEDGKAYAWTFTPADTHNYTILTGTLVPYVDDGMDYIPGVIGGNTGSFNFHDVSRLDYFYDAVKWAAENGIASGTGRYTFSPNAVCTRAQTVTFLWRAAGSPLPRYRVCPFTDVQPSDYYYNAVLWAVEQGITTGLNATTFGPDVTVTRGQVATFLYRAASAAKPNTFSPFTDVKTTAYNYNAILWAYDNRITTGTSDTTFSPDAYCTRAQIVTFLYRYYQGR